MSKPIEENVTDNEIAEDEIAEFEELMAASPENNFDIYNPFRVDTLEMQKSGGLWERFVKQVDSVPSPIKDILFNIGTMELLIRIAENFNLSRNQSRELSRIIRDVLLGNAYVGNMLQDITNRLALDSGAAKAIANEIVSELFSPAIEDIKKIQIGRKEIGTPPSAAGVSYREVQGSNVVDLRGKGKA